MGLRTSSLAKPKISMTWVLKGGDHSTAPVHTKPRDAQDCFKGSELSVAEVGRRREKRLHHRRPRRPRSKSNNPSRFGYEITDVDAFLSKASLDNPGNIPVVLSSPCLLYQTRPGHQHELSLPLGMVVNAVFKNQGWLYVQTPHGEEGYVRYASCLPLGILPPRAPAPCWETHTDIFPMPLGNRTDTEKVRVGGGTRSECGGTRPRRNDTRDTMSACGERSVDRLYLRAASRASNTTRHTLLVVSCDYTASGRSTLSVGKGDVVALVSGHVKDWFYVRTRTGEEGFIPAAVAGHGFL